MTIRTCVVNDKQNSCILETMTGTQDASQPLLILIRGVPGSGKSHLTTALKKSIERSILTRTVVTLDPDATDYTSKAYAALSQELTAQGVDLKFHPYRFLRSKAYAGITAHDIIIWNQPFTNLDGFEKTVKNLQAYASEHGTQLLILVVEVEIDPIIAEERVVHRKERGGHGPSKATFDRFIDDYVSFSDKGYNTVVVHGEDELSISVSTVMKAIEYTHR